MENNNSNKMTIFLVAVSVILIMLGGCGLDSENIVIPSVLIMLGLVCGMVAFFAGKDL